MTDSQSPITGKVVLVTGAGRGAGRAIAEAFAAQGAAVAVNDINPDSAAETVRRITAAGGRAREYLADVSKKFPVQAMLNQIEEDWGGLDILINSARVAPNRTLLEMDEWDWRRTLDVNLTGVFVMTQTAGRIMRASGKGGAIVNVVQAAGGANRAAYRAAEAGVIELTRAARDELEAYNIRVNSITMDPEMESYSEIESKMMGLFSGHVAQPNK